MSAVANAARIGILGGTFDPIHVGHLLIAELAWEQLGLSEVRFLLAAQSPLKAPGSAASNQHRWEMVRLATGGNPHFVADDREIRRGGTSYTVDTLREMRSELPQAELFFILGADALADLDAWREPAEICRLANLAVLARGGHELPNLTLLENYLPADRRGSSKEHVVHAPQIEISSTDLRQRVRTKQSIRYQVHPAVEAYIETHQLYRGEPPEPA